MANLQMPDRYNEGIKKINSLSMEAFSTLLKVIESATPLLSKDKLIDFIANNQKDIGRTDVIEILAATAAINSTRDFTDLSLTKFLDSLFVAEKAKELQMSESEIVKIKERLTRLSKSNILTITAKATSVLTSHDHVFLNSRIFTDIRTIFAESEENNEAGRPAAAVLVHMLRLRYVESGQRKEFFVALDDSDLKKLTKTIQRASQKAESLRSVIKSSGLSFLPTSEE